MKKNSTAGVRNPLLLCAIILGLMAALVAVPYQFSSSASGKQVSKGLFQRTESHEEGLENYDIRADKSAYEKIAGFRQSQNKDAAVVADIRGEFVSGEELLRTKVPTLKVEYNTDIRTPEVIAPDVKQGRAFLTGSSAVKRSDILRTFVKENNSLIGVSDAQADSLIVTADYTNPDGNLSFAHLEQFINGIPVFRGEVKAGFTKSGEMIRVINNLAPGLDYSSLSTDFGNPLDAVRAAAGHINADAGKLDLRQNNAASTDLKTIFGEGDWATGAEKMYFPTEPGVAVPAWRVNIWLPVNAYYVIVDAQSGTMLWRKNVTEDQTQSATYNVYTNSNAMINVADNPFPQSPGPVTPNGAQGAAISRTSITRIGNEAPYTFNNNGWITDGGNETDGNAIEAGLDRDTTNGVDLANGRAVGTSRTFNFPVNPFNPNTNSGDVPTPVGEPVTGNNCAAIVQPHGMVDAQRAAITQLFYITNWYHDELYRLGFTEQARNFQGSNFGRGGVENDRVSAEAQDCSGVNNANFGTLADGNRGRMQMYLWTGPTPDLDGDFDAEVIIHEFSHGLSNRLHGNASGLSSNMSRGMGEGWGDFYGHAMLSEPTDPINGIYTAGGYDTYLISAGFTNNFYYGIRRYPKAVIGFTGGANNKPHNAFTFSYANSDCNTKLNNTNFAFARGPVGVSTCDQVHNLGEIWSSTLWEVRAKYVTRLGWADGNRRMLQFVTDGMKLAPLGPTFLQERDAIIAAAQASGLAAADVGDLWAGFALRGMGFSALVNNAGTGANNTVVVDGFDLPNLLQTPTVTVSDSTGDNDGFPEPNEPITISVPLTNNTGNAATGTTLQLVGGGSANYGTIANGQTVIQNVTYTVPSGTPCGSAITLTFNVNSSLGATSFTRVILIGVPQTTFTENFDGAVAPAFPAGWTAASVQSGINFVNSPLNADTAPNSAFALDPATVGGGTNLTSPNIPITTTAATVSFRNRFDTEGGWDGGVLEISINGGAFQDIITAGGRFIENGYNGALGAGTNNPLANRQAWSGNSNGYLTTTVQLPSAAAGLNVQLRWRFGADDNTVGQGPNSGWYVDTIRVNGNSTCSFVPTPSGRERADFDGDGRTDISVFRPSEGNWYVNQSTAGFGVVNWGVSTDLATPGDFDGDGKTDFAIFRPSTGYWWILRSSDLGYGAAPFGTSGDIPVQGDYDGDGKTDLAVYRPSNNGWYIANSTGGYTITGFGTAGDTPVRADYNGDGKTDIAIFRPSTGQWWISNSGGGVSVVNLGVSTDKLVPADYDGDNKEDVAVYRPSTGQWFWIRSIDGTLASLTWGGNAADIPVPGNYDGDAYSDLAVYRNGTWHIYQTSTGGIVVPYGLSTDTAIPTRYIP
jgi:hypothetical protein